MATADLKAAPVRAEHPGIMSPADLLAHEAASHVTWRARERYLAAQSANGHIATTGGRLLADVSGPAQIEVTVDYVTPVSPDGVAYLIVTGLDRQGTALVVIDGCHRAEAVRWMDERYASLQGRATTLFGQPGLDLRQYAAVA